MSTVDRKRDLIKKFVNEYRGFTCFILLQLVIVLLSFTGLFGEVTRIELDGNNLDISDEKVMVNDDSSMYITGRNDAETYGRWIAGTMPFDLREGMYEVAVDYWSLLYDTEVGGNCEDITGALQMVRTTLTDDKLCYNDLLFKDGWEFQKTRMWIRDIGGEKGLQVKVNFYGVGELRIDKITITELPMWRFMKFLAWIIGFATMDIIIWYFLISRNAKNKPAVAMLICAVFFVSLPLLTDSLFWGHDLDFHLNRIMALANGLEAGKIFVPIQTEVLNGYGYASPLFYSQLFLYLPAVLYNLAVPIQTCYQIYAIFVNIATCLIAYYCFKGIVKDSKIAAAGAVVYLLSAYRITNLYIRAAVGEYTAMAFFPLIVYGFFRVYTRDEKKLGISDYLPIIAGLSGLIESHVLSCELSAMFIAVVCLVNFKKTFSVKRFLTLAKAAILTLFVNMAFILPFVDSMQMNIRVNKEPVNHIQVHGTYLQQVFSAFQISFGDSRRGMGSEMPLSLGLALVVGVIIFVACSSMRNEWNIKKNNIYKTGMICTVFTIASIILSMRFFPWDSLENMNKILAKILCIVQFPWRYLSMATIFAAVATIAGLSILKSTKSAKTVNILLGMLCLISTMTYGLCMAYFTDSINIERVYGDADVEKAISSGEYIIADTIEGNLRWRRINANENFITISDYKYEGGITTFNCTNTADIEMAVEIPLMNYDNYHAYDTISGTDIGIMNGTDNRVSLAVPANFDGNIKVAYRFPVLWRIAYVMSAVSVIFIIIISVFGKKFSQRKKVQSNGL